MLHEKDLVEFYSSVAAKQEINLEQLATTMQQIASTNEVPFVSKMEPVKFGSLIRSHTDDCIRISHPDHAKDYYSILVNLDKNNLIIYRYGFSKQMEKKMEKQQAKRGGGTFVRGLFTGHEPGDGVAGNIAGAGIMMKGTASAIFHGIKALGGSKDKLKEEEAWYDAIYAVLCQAVS